MDKNNFDFSDHLLLKLHGFGELNGSDVPSQIDKHLLGPKYAEEKDHQETWVWLSWGSSACFSVFLTMPLYPYS